MVLKSKKLVFKNKNKLSRKRLKQYGGMSIASQALGAASLAAQGTAKSENKKDQTDPNKSKSKSQQENKPKQTKKKILKEKEYQTEKPGKIIIRNNNKTLKTKKSHIIKQTKEGEKYLVDKDGNRIDIDTRSRFRRAFTYTGDPEYGADRKKYEDGAIKPRKRDFYKTTNMRGDIVSWGKEKGRKLKQFRTFVASGKMEKFCQLIPEGKGTVLDSSKISRLVNNHKFFKGEDETLWHYRN